VDERHTVVLVEGLSDQAALHALAERRGLDLAARGVAVVPIGGATNITRFLELYGPGGSDLRLAGLCDAGEAGAFRRGLERTGIGAPRTNEEMEDYGFYVCEADLEDELIRALGVERVEAAIAEAGETAIWHTFRRQPAQRGRPTTHQLRRFMGTKSGRKLRYGRLLIEALEPGAEPRPLAGVIDNL
jgi:hypothetical protein